MNIWPLKNISSEEASDILSKHRTIYDGYRSIQTNTPNTQPLYVQDFAGDKEGMVINNKGTVKKYTNYRINESKEMCNECGGQMMEGECMECGMQYESECLDCVDNEIGEGIYDVEDLNPGEKFDYIEDEYQFEEMGSAWADDLDEDISGVQGIYNDMDPAYDFDSEGPGGAGPYQRTSYNEEELDEEEVDEWMAPVLRAAAAGAGSALVNKAFDESEIEEGIDDDLKESFRYEKTRIMEMMGRMKVLK